MSDAEILAEDFAEVLRERVNVSSMLVELAELMRERAGAVLRDDQLLLGIGCRLAADLENQREMLRALEEATLSEGQAYDGALDGETKEIRAMRFSIGDVLDTIRLHGRACPRYQRAGYDRALAAVLLLAEFGGDE